MNELTQPHSGTELEEFNAALATEIAKLAELLPLQGPITAFAFLNPLQGLENRPFVDALRHVASVYGCEPFLQESRYRQKIKRGRITVDELREVLLEEPGNHMDSLVGGLMNGCSQLQHAATSCDGWQ